jgi:hypothetical protein
VLTKIVEVVKPITAGVLGISTLVLLGSGLVLMIPGCVLFGIGLGVNWLYDRLTMTGVYNGE